MLSRRSIARHARVCVCVGGCSLPGNMMGVSYQGWQKAEAAPMQCKMHESSSMVGVHVMRCLQAVLTCSEGISPAMQNKMLLEGAALQSSCPQAQAGHIGVQCVTFLLWSMHTADLRNNILGLLYTAAGSMTAGCTHVQDV